MNLAVVLRFVLGLALSVMSFLEVPCIWRGEVVVCYAVVENGDLVVCCLDIFYYFLHSCAVFLQVLLISSLLYNSRML